MFLLAAAHPAHAQYGGGPGGPGGSGGSWGDPTTTYSGSFDYNYVYYGTTYTGPDSWAAHYSQFLWVNSDPGVPSNVTSQGTYTVKRTWSGSAPPPTKPVYILETSYAIGSGGIYGNTPGSGTAQDAFNDDPVPVSGGVSSTGKKLVQVDGSSGVISLSGTISASGDTPANDYSAYQGNTAVYSGVNSSFSWDFDSRAVMITSSLGQTYHKSAIHFDSDGVALGDPDDPTPDGTTNANSVKPSADVDELITYAANPIGSWAADSSYHWHLNQGRPYLSSSDGTFTMSSDPPNNYQALYNLSDLGKNHDPEHVYIHLTSASDGANATNNYYITWHDPVENWAKLGSSTEVAPKLFGTSDSAQPANGFVNIKIAPDTVDWSVAEHDAGGVVTTAAAVLAIAQPETSPIVIGLMTAAGYTLSVATPPDPTIYTPQGTEAQFAADVDTQNNITNGNTTGVFLPGAKRMDPTLAANIAASGDYQGYFEGAYNHSFNFSVQAYRHRFAQPWFGDGYGTQGYYGRVSGTVTTSGSLEYVYNWN